MANFVHNKLIRAGKYLSSTARNESLRPRSFPKDRPFFDLLLLRLALSAGLLSTLVGSSASSGESRKRLEDGDEASLTSNGFSSSLKTSVWLAERSLLDPRGGGHIFSGLGLRVGFIQYIYDYKSLDEVRILRSQSGSNRTTDRPVSNNFHRL